VTQETVDILSSLQQEFGIPSYTITINLRDYLSMIQEFNVTQETVDILLILRSFGISINQSNLRDYLSMIQEFNVTTETLSIIFGLNARFQIKRTESNLRDYLSMIKELNLTNKSLYELGTEKNQKIKEALREKGLLTLRDEPK
jgi:histidyl-tRNA synthetase